MKEKIRIACLSALVFVCPFRRRLPSKVHQSLIQLATEASPVGHEESREQAIDRARDA